MSKLSYSDIRDKLTPEKRAGAIKLLAEKSMFAAACEMGIDKYFDNKAQVNNFMYRMYLEAKTNPDSVGLHPDVIMEVDSALQRRSVGRGRELAEADDATEKLSTIKETEIKDIVITGRNKASILIDKKMNYLMKNKKALQKESLVNLAKVFGIFFDKSQIVQGQATENIAVMAKIDENLTPEQAMDALLKTREKILEGREE